MFVIKIKTSYELEAETYRSFYFIESAVKYLLERYWEIKTTRDPESITEIENGFSYVKNGVTTSWWMEEIN